MPDAPAHSPQPAALDAAGHWQDDPAHRDWLALQAERQMHFFAQSVVPGRTGFARLDYDGTPLHGTLQELHATTRMVHAYALAHSRGFAGALSIVEYGMDVLTTLHRDQDHGGFLWAVDTDGVRDGVKLAYGHVFVLLAASSAKAVGHPRADDLLQEITALLDQHYWEADNGRFCDEFARDWTPFSDYRGMNANMHGVEALLAAYEVTGVQRYLDQAGQILAFFIGKMAPDHGWRLPEHYDATWQVDRAYAGNHMFRPAGTTPGHAFEMARLNLQHWDLAGRPESDAPAASRNLVYRALSDGWLPDGGLAYTVGFDGKVLDPSRFWWPLTEAIGAISALLAVARTAEDEVWYRRLWQFAEAHFIDPDHGGWFPAIDATGQPTSSIFAGKPDIYHALQACLIAQSGRLSRML